MKKIVFLAIVAIALFACNRNKPSENQNKSGEKQVLSETNSVNTSTASDAMTTFSIEEIVNQYLQIKNGLASDNGTEAANGGNAFVESIAKIDITSLPSDKRKVWEDIYSDAKEMAEHIGKNADKLEHQREHFEILSKDMYDLVKTFGSKQVLYKYSDSMYNNGKGAFWLNETKEIKNPYMGKAMSNSGTLEEEIK